MAPWSRRVESGAAAVTGRSAKGGPRDAGGAPDGAAPAAGLELDHVAIAVRSFGDMVPVLERLAGAAATAPRRVESQGVEVCFVGRVEVIRPLGDGGAVARFVERRGPGLHHVAYRVGDVGRAMREMAADGVRFTSAAPMMGAGGHRIAFIHPASAGGVLVELVERDG